MRLPIRDPTSLATSRPSRHDVHILFCPTSIDFAYDSRMTEPTTPFDPAPPSGAALPSTALVPLRERHDGWTPERQRDFIERLAETGSVRAACAHVGMSEASAYALKRRAAARAFADCWDAAAALGHRRLLETAWDRAVNGTVRTHLYHGEVVAETRVFSDRLLVYLLERTRPPTEVAHDRDAAVARVLADWDAALARIGQPVEEADADAEEDAEEDIDHGFLTWQTEGGEWRTSFPPPPGFRGEEQGRYGDPDYSRTLDDEELRSVGEIEDEERAWTEQLRRRVFGLDRVPPSPPSSPPFSSPPFSPDHAACTGD